MNPELTAEIHRLAGELLSLGRLANAEEKDLVETSDVEVSDEVLAAHARKELKARQLRAQYLPADMFAEGGWNILLDLFVSEVANANVSVTDACIAANVPTTTALRHLGLLIDRGLVRRSTDVRDVRRVYLSLSAEGRSSIRNALAAMYHLGNQGRNGQIKWPAR